MRLAAPINVISIWTALATFGAAATMPARREMRAETTPLAPLPAPLPLPRLPEPVPGPPLLPPASSALALAAKTPGAIGAAEMEPNGTIRLHLRVPARSARRQSFLPTVPMSPPQEQIGYDEIELDRGHLHYRDVLRHLGGLVHGQVKPVPPWRAEEQWHCALDPNRGPCPLQHLLPDRTAMR
jgi:hypothetical protein